MLAVVVVVVIVILEHGSTSLRCDNENTDLKQLINGCVQTGGKSDLNQVQFVGLTVHIGVVSVQIGSVSVQTGPHY